MVPRYAVGKVRYIRYGTAKAGTRAYAPAHLRGVMCRASCPAPRAYTQRGCGRYAYPTARACETVALHFSTARHRRPECIASEEHGEQPHVLLREEAEDLVAEGGVPAWHQVRGTGWRLWWRLMQRI